MATQKTHSEAAHAAHTNTTPKPTSHQPTAHPRTTHQPATKSTAKKPSSKAKSSNKFTNIIFAILTALAVVIAVVVIIVTSHSTSSLTVKNGRGEKITTSYRSFGDNSFQLKIPTEFTELDKNTIADKYGTETPNYAYLSKDDDVSITIKISDSTMTDDQIVTYLNTLKTIFNASGNILHTDSYQVDNHTVATIQLSSESALGDLSNQMLFFSQHDRLVVITFSCPTDQRDVWQVVGEFIAKSLTFQQS